MTDTALAPLTIDRRDNGAVVWLDGGDRPVVVMTAALLGRLDETLHLLQNEAPAWIVLASTSTRSFVAGADLAEICDLSDADLALYMEEGQRVLGRIAAWPQPIVAALGGATLGGGLELALHCHAIVASVEGASGKPWPIGLPEAGLGLCPAWGGTQLLAGRIDPAIAIEATTQGRPFKSDAMPEGLADHTLATHDDLLEASCTVAANMSSRRPVDVTQVDAASLRAACAAARETSDAAGGAVIECIEAALAGGLEVGLAAERRHIIDLRNTQETRDRIAAFLNRG